MTDYKKMYTILCVGISEAMDRMRLSVSPEAYMRLQDALHEAEEVYINTCEDAPEE